MSAFESPKYEERPPSGQSIWADGAWAWPGERDLSIVFHSGYEVGVVLDGEEEMLFEGFSMTCGPGDVWLCAAWEPHGWRVPAGGVRTIVPHFLPEFLGDASAGRLPWQALFEAAPTDRPQAQNADMRRHFREIGEDLSRESHAKRASWQHLVRLGVLHLLTELSRDWSPPGTIDTRRPSGRRLRGGDLPKQLLPAVMLVQNAPGHRVSVEEAAEACAMGRSRFQLEFRLAAGTTFGRFCMRKRLDAACAFLLSERLTIKEIAARTGFWDDSHFHRCFAAEYGLTPGEYRLRRGTRASGRTSRSPHV